MTTATKSFAPSSEKIGGQYDWELGADGKYTIKDVEVFSSHAFGENGVQREVTEAWIDAAHERLVQNYPKHMIPVVYSVEHRSETKKHLGFLRPTRTGKIEVSGKKRNTMFGDVVGIEPSDFEDFKRTKYPFRSASIASFSQHRLMDLSMLREGPGYFEYPILTPAENESVAALAYHAISEDSGEFLYAFGANDKKKSKKPGDKSGSDKSGGDSKSKKSSGSNPFAKKDGSGNQDGSGNPADGENAAVDENGDPIGGAAGEDQQPEGMTDGMSVDEKLDAILACVKQLMMDSVPSEDEVNGNKAPSQDTGASKKNYSAKEDSVSKENEVKIGADKSGFKPVFPEVVTETKSEAKTAAQDDAKYSALEDRTAKLEKKISSKENAEKTVFELEAEGYRLTPKTKEKIATYAAKGEDSLKDFVDTYKTYAEKDPPTSSEGGGTGSPSGVVGSAKVSGLPSDVAEYAAKNPADKGGISLRAKLFPEYQVYKAQGGGINTFERFVQSELAAQASQGVAVE